MAKYRITSPSGEEFEITAPDDATEEQVLSYARDQFNQQRSGSDQGALAPGAPEDPGFAGRMLRNIPSSAAQTAKAIAQPFLHPIETAKSVDLLTRGLARKARPGDPTPAQPREYYGGAPLESLPEGQRQIAAALRAPLEDDQAVETANAVIGAMVDRYGSLEAVKNTLETDPVGFVFDISGLLTAGGSLAAKVPGVAKAGQVTAAAGRSLDPVNIAAAVPSKAAKPLLESATKLGTTVRPAKRSAIIDLMLEHKIMPTQKGLEKLNRISGKVDDQIAKIVSEATQAGKTIKADDILRYIDDLKKDLGGVNFEGTRKLKIVDKLTGQWREQLKGVGRDTLTPLEVQEFKKNIYRDLGDLAYTSAVSGKSKPVKTEALKVVARGAKDSLEDVIPDAQLRELNRQRGAMASAQQKLPAQVARIENRDPFGLVQGVLAGGGVAADLAYGLPGLGAATGIGLGIAQRPVNTAAIAMLLQRLGEGRASAPLVLGHQALLQGGRLQQEEEERRRKLADLLR